ncbi:MAG: sel1 repeat family protein [Acidobacteria bacterium]|nr:sel1 repeat family protein [Acidobacteriota bacterium]
MRSQILSAVLLLPLLSQAADIRISDLRTRAEAGDATAQVLLGDAYRDGAGVAQNYEQAAKWYSAAAEQGNAEAQGSLGFLYSLGRGVDRDYASAEKWYRKAAKQGNAVAMFNLGTLYYNGNGVAINDTSAYAWFALAEKAGSKEGADAVRRMTTELPAWRLADGKIALANMLLAGDDIPRAFAEAVRLYEELAAQMPQLWVRLAKVYIVGSAVPHDYRRAEQYCMNAASAKVISGMTCLGYLYASGFLLPESPERGFFWYDKAAHLGDPFAWYGLGLMYYEGRGTKQDNHQGYKWLLIATRAYVPTALKSFDSVNAQIDGQTAKKLQRKAFDQQRRASQEAAKLPYSRQSEPFDVLLIPHDSATSK